MNRYVRAALVPSQPVETAHLGRRLLQNSQEMLELLKARRTQIERQMDRDAP